MNISYPPFLTHDSSDRLHTMLNINPNVLFIKCKLIQAYDDLHWLLQSTSTRSWTVIRHFRWLVSPLSLIFLLLVATLPISMSLFHWQCFLKKMEGWEQRWHWPTIRPDDGPRPGRGGVGQFNASHYMNGYVYMRRTIHLG